MALSKPPGVSFSPNVFFQEGENVLIFQGPLMRKAQCIWVAVENEQVRYLVRYPSAKYFSEPRAGAAASLSRPVWRPSLARCQLSSMVPARCQLSSMVPRYRPLGNPMRSNPAHPVILGKGTAARDPVPVAPKVFCKDQVYPLAPADWDYKWLPEGTVLRYCRAYMEMDEDAYVNLQMAAQRKPYPERPLLSSGCQPVGTKGAANPEKGREHVYGTEDQAAAPIEPDKPSSSNQEFEVNLPRSLRYLLVLDRELMTHQKKLCTLPARKTVNAILTDYAIFQSHQQVTDKKHAVGGLLALIKEYFDLVLGTQLLYKFEKLQYAGVLAIYPARQMSQIYGGAHLLRLFPQMSSMVACTPLDISSRNVLLKNFQEFLEYLASNPSQLFTAATDYQVASAEYQKRAESQLLPD